jgi:hypothetical protein
MCPILCRKLNSPAGSAVLSIYTKSGGKNGKHGWVQEVSSIAAVSYTPVQIFENLIGRHFRAVPQALTWLQVNQFALMPSSSFLCVLDEAPWRIMESQNVQVSALDSARFDKLARQKQQIILAIKMINSRPHKGKEPEHDSSEDEG